MMGLARLIKLFMRTSALVQLTNLSRRSDFDFSLNTLKPLPLNLRIVYYVIHGFQGPPTSIYIYIYASSMYIYWMGIYIIWSRKGIKSLKF